MRRGAAFAAGSLRAASFEVRPISRVAAPLTSCVRVSRGDPVSRPHDCSARSATFSSSGLVSYLLRLGSFWDVCRAETAEFQRDSNDLVIDRLPTARALVNAK